MFEEQLVALEVRVGGGFDELTLAVVDDHAGGSEIDGDFAGIADHLTTAAGGPLDVILVDVDRDGPVVDETLHGDAGDILDIDRQAAQLAAHRENSAG